MKPLLGLLKAKEISHPSKITSVNISNNGTVKLEVEGYPWWTNSPSDNEIDSITFIFEGCYDGVLSLEDLTLDHNEYLEYFHLEKYQGTDLATEEEHSIFCNAALIDPQKILNLTYDFLVTQDLQPILHELLNFGPENTTEYYFKVTRSKCFLLSRCPDKLKDILVEELNKQHVPFLLESYRSVKKQNYLVRLGSTQFFCEDAWAQV